MAQERLDKHDGIHHELFDEDTNQIGSLGDIVEKHAGDAVFLAPAEKSAGGVDGGESDFEAEMLEADPAPDAGMDAADLYNAEDQEGVFATDGSGTVQGIARGFGTHLPQDIGAGGFQVETLPDSALNGRRRPPADGEELDDYDDDAQGNPSPASEPFSHMVSEDPDRDGEPTPNRIPLRQPHPSNADEALDATRRMK